MYSVNRCVPGQELATGARSYAKVGADGLGRKGSRDSGYVDLIPPSSATETAFSTPRAGPCRTAVNAKWARYGSRRAPPDDQSATSTGQHPQRHRRSPVAVPTAAGLARWWRFPWSFPRFSTEVMTDGRGAAGRHHTRCRTNGARTSPMCHCHCHSRTGGIGHSSGYTTPLCACAGELMRY